MANQRLRSWCFTLYVRDGVATPGDHMEVLAGLLGEYREPESKPQLRYAVFQSEVGVLSEEYHIQGYFQWEKPKRLNWLTRRIKHDDWKPIHLEPAKGTPGQNKTYCTKDDTRCEDPIEIGNISETSTAGRRTDIHDLADAIVERGADAIDDYAHMLIRYPRGVQALVDRCLERRFNNLPNFREIRVVVHVGAPGTGKTRAVYEHAQRKYGQRPYRPLSFKPEWWCGYVDQKVLLFDDFYGGLPLNRMLHILDGYPIKCPRKGGHIFSFWTEIHITSNCEWKEWYQIINHPETDSHFRLIGAFSRRITETIHYN